MGDLLPELVFLLKVFFFFHLMFRVGGLTYKFIMLRNLLQIMFGLLFLQSCQFMIRF